MVIPNEDYHEVFISYSHDSAEHKAQVLALCNRLRNDGIDAYIDRYVLSPPEGWPQWMRRQIEHAAYVLVICTETYRKRFENEELPQVGLGARLEGTIITQSIYEAECKNGKFIPVVMEAKDVPHRPAVLQPATYYDLSVPEGYDWLYRYLTNQPEITVPELGRRRELPPVVTEDLLQADTEVKGSYNSPHITDIGRATKERDPNLVQSQMESAPAKMSLPRDEPVLMLVALPTPMDVRLQLGALAGINLRKNLVQLVLLGENALFEMRHGIEEDFDEERLVLYQTDDRGPTGAFTLAERGGMVALGVGLPNRRPSSLDMEDLFLLDRKRVLESLKLLVNNMSELYPLIYDYKGDLFIKAAVLNMGSRFFGEGSKSHGGGWRMYDRDGNDPVWVPSTTEVFEFPENKESSSAFANTLLQLFHMRFRKDGRLAGG